MEQLEEAWNLIQQCRFAKDRSRDKVERAILLLETIPLDKQYSFYLGQRGLVVFPDLLSRFLQLRPVLELDDYESMLARCIEYHHDEESKEDDWHHQSLMILLAYPHDGATLQLLPGRYHINENLYERAKSAGIRDLYYEGILTDPRFIKSPEDREVAGQYGGYRAAYYLLLYGGSRRRELVDWWKKWQYDCTYDAACHFYRTTDQNEIHRLLMKED